MGHVIRADPETIAEYRRLHTDNWHGVLARFRASGITNYSIYLKQPENILFGYWEYAGTDFDADAAAIATDEATRAWWGLCDPMQEAFETHAEGECWTRLEEIFHLD